MDNGLLALFIVGLLGGGHCAGMCGGIVGALSLQTPPSGTAVLVHLAYNLGRIGSYVIAGLLAGALGQAAGSLMAVQHGLYLFASLMLVAMGLYLLGLTQFLAPLERGGQALWQRIQPLTQRFLPVRGIAQALPLGLLWGWLPCGLVYGALATALGAGSAGQGALLMLAFGLGTLPNLLLAGLLLARFRRFAQARVTRIVAGLLVLGYGIHGLYNIGRP
jgi:sulfite exporter TauE/SafE